MPQPNISFWPENERDPFIAQLYDVLERGLYSHLEYIVLTQLKAYGYQVPADPGLWDGLVEGFLRGIFDLPDAPTINPARLTELEEAHGTLFSTDTYQRVYSRVHSNGWFDAQWILKDHRNIPPPELVDGLLAKLYFRMRVQRSNQYVFDAMRSHFGNIVAEILRPGL